MRNSTEKGNINELACLLPPKTDTQQMIMIIGSFTVILDDNPTGLVARSRMVVV